jgi:hypothetical protein
MNERPRVSWIDRKCAEIVTSLTFLVSALLTALGLRPRHDPWRRMLGLRLRSEGVKPALTAFGLKPFDAETLSAREFEALFLENLFDFLSAERETHYALERRADCDFRRLMPYLDVSFARFAEDGQLISLQTRIDSRHPLDASHEERQATDARIIEVFNATRRLPEVERGLKTCAQVTSAYGRRILSSCLLSIEGDDDGYYRGDRFAPPDFRMRRSLALGFLNFVARRIGPSEVDLWMQLHHVGNDGIPLQAMLSRLEKSWESPELVRFHDDGRIRVQPVSMPGERDLWLGVDYFDFQPLLELRAMYGGGVPVTALFLWMLNKQPEFQGTRFAIAADVPARGDEPRAVDLISIRPAEFGDSLDEFSRAFRELADAARERSTPTWLLLKQAAQLPLFLLNWMARTHPELAHEAMGTVGLTMLRDAKVVLAPMADVDFDGGFFAIGSLALPSERGAVAAVTVRGSEAQARVYPAVVRRVMKDCARLQSLLDAHGTGQSIGRKPTNSGLPLVGLSDS